MRFLMLVLALVLPVAGCAVPVAGTPLPMPGPAAPAVAAGSFTDALGRFSLEPPPGWVADTSGAGGTAVLLRDPRPAGAFTANLNVLVVPAAGDLPATVAAARADVARLPGSRALRDEPTRLSGGAAAHLLGGLFTDGSGHELQNMQLFAVHGGETLVVTATALDATWAQHAGIFDAALRSVTVGSVAASARPGLAE